MGITCQVVPELLRGFQTVALTTNVRQNQGCVVVFGGVSQHLNNPEKCGYRYTDTCSDCSVDPCNPFSVTMEAEQADLFQLSRICQAVKSWASEVQQRYQSCQQVLLLRQEALPVGKAVC